MSYTEFIRQEVVFDKTSYHDGGDTLGQQNHGLIACDTCGEGILNVQPYQMKVSLRSKVKWFKILVPQLSKPNFCFMAKQLLTDELPVKLLYKPKSFR